MKLPELRPVAHILNEGRPHSNEVHTILNTSSIAHQCNVSSPPSPTSFPPPAEKSVRTCCPHAGVDGREAEDAADVPAGQGQ